MGKSTSARRLQALGMVMGVAVLVWSSASQSAQAAIVMEQLEHAAILGNLLARLHLDVTCMTDLEQHQVLNKSDWATHT